MAQAQKIQLQRLDTSASPFSYTQMAGVVGVGDLDMSRESVDDTEMDQTSNFMEFVRSALIDAGELELTLKFNQSGTAENQLYQDFVKSTDIETNETYRLQLPVGSPNETITFTGFITSFGGSFPATERMTRVVTFKVSGKPTLSWASPQ